MDMGMDITFAKEGTAAAEAISAAEVVTKTVDEEHTFTFEYPLMSAANTGTRSAVWFLTRSIISRTGNCGMF